MLKRDDCFLWIEIDVVSVGSELCLLSLRLNFSIVTLRSLACINSQNLHACVMFPFLTFVNFAA